MPCLSLCSQTWSLERWSSHTRILREGRKEGREERKKEENERRYINACFPWVPSPIIHFPFPTQTLLLMRDPTFKPRSLSLVSDWNSVSGFCILLYIHFEVTQNEKKEWASTTEFWTISPSTSIGVKKNIHVEKMIVRRIGNRTALQKVQLHKPFHQAPHLTLPTQTSGTHLAHSAQDPPVS